MEKLVLQPLSQVEKEQAEKWHDLIYCFLHKNGYSIEIYYSIAVFGFLKGIQVWHRKKEVNGKYQLPYVSWQYMRAECSNYCRTENAQKRKPTEPVISLDVEEGLHDCIGGKSVEDDFIDREMVKEILAELNCIQEIIVKKKMEGYTNTEIILECDIRPSTLYRNLAVIQRKVLERMS